MEQRLQGTDITVKLTLTDSTGTAVDPTTLDGYLIEIYTNDQKKNSLLTFAKTPATGQEPIEVVDAPGGIVQIVIPRAWTNDARTGIIYAEMKVKSTATSQYQSSKAVSGKGNIVICELINSSNPDAII